MTTFFVGTIVPLVTIGAICGFVGVLFANMDAPIKLNFAAAAAGALLSPSLVHLLNAPSVVYVLLGGLVTFGVGLAIGKMALSRAR